MNTEPLFKAGDMVRTPMGEVQRVIQCDLHGCTVDNGTRGGARYAPERLTRAQSAKLTLKAITTATAQWAGMAPKVAGGWVMNCEVGDMAMDRLLATDEKLGLVPDSYEGRSIDPEKALAALNEAIERTAKRQWCRHGITQDLATLRGWVENVKLATV